MSSPLFAAPAATAAPSAGAGLAEVTLALIVILGVIAGLAWFARRMRRFGAGGAGRIQVLGDHVLGVKERAVLVRVGDTDILIGVAAGNVRALHVFPVGANTEGPPEVPGTAPRLPDFKELLMRSLGRKEQGK